MLPSFLRRPPQRAHQQPKHRFLSPLLTLLLLLLSGPVLAGNISFGLALTGDRLRLTHQGDSNAYYPEVLQLQTDGQWKPLSYPPQGKQPAQIRPGSTLELQWQPVAGTGSIASVQPHLVRFFDQAGAGIGQLTFFARPPETTEPLVARYVRGKMQIQPPPVGSPIQATWILWGQEEGIAPLARSDLTFQHHQPPALRIHWDAERRTQEFDLGQGQPLVLLLHETETGPLLQTLPSQLLRGREQRALWLGLPHILWQSGLALAALSFLALAICCLSRWKRNPAA